MIVVNGMGCVESGAREVLLSFARVFSCNQSDTERVVVLCVPEVAGVLSRCSKGLGHVTIFALSHRLWGRWLRLTLELALGAAAWLRVARVVNLSHYGWCFGGRYSLFFHSEVLLDDANNTGWSEGRANWLKSHLLLSCFSSARVLAVQTEHIASRINWYCKEKRVATPVINIMIPKVNLVARQRTQKQFELQMFYPCSRFLHKRAELAVEATVAAAHRKKGLGLVITRTGIDRREIRYVGSQKLSSAHRYLISSDAMLFTSERESLGLPLLEAIEAGVAVIAPRVDYAEEILGEAGIYFDCWTPESVASAIHACFDNLESWKEKTVVRRRYMRRVCLDYRQQWRVLIGI